ncbi:MAG: TonB-dependent receptor [Pseudomonadota bacterium]
MTISAPMAALRQIFAVVAFGVLSASALADNHDLVKFDIEVQSFESALEKFAAQSRRQVSANSLALRGIESQAVRGSFTPREALDILIGDAALSVIELDGGGVAIQANSTDQPESGYRLETLEEIRVIGTRPTRYQALTSSSVTGIDASLFDTARSVQVIPEQIILDQEAQDLRDVLRNVSGVQARNESGGTTDSFIIRGFETVNIWRDGLQISRNSQRIQTANIERVEVVKGPDALLAGTSSPGGRVNVITKLPKPQARRTVSTTFDEYGRKELLLDLTGPISRNENLLYRLVAFTDNSDTFRRTDVDANIQRNLIAPSLTWRINGKNKLTATVEFTSGDLPFDEGTVAIQDASGNLSVVDVDQSIRFGEDSDRNETDSFTYRLSYDFEINDSWQLDANIDYQKTETSSFSNLPLGGFNDTVSGLFPPGFFDVWPDVTRVAAGLFTNPGALNSSAVFESGDLIRNPLLFNNENRRTMGNLQLSGQFVWGVTEHSFIAGINHIHRELEVVGEAALIDAVDVGFGAIFPALPPGTLIIAGTNFNVFNPVYGRGATRPSDQTPRLNNESESAQTGFYAQDRIDFGEKWIATMGLRHDRFDAEFNSTSFFTEVPGGGGIAFLPIPSTTLRRDDEQTATTGNAGMMFQPTENLSLFASFSQSFQPNGSSTDFISGEQVVLDPSEGEQIEFGIKGRYLDNKVFFSLAWYDIERTNVPFGRDPTTQVTLLDGKQESSGIELDATVQFFDGLSFLFSYAHTTKAKVTEGFNEGNRIRQTPYNSASFWATYEVTDGRFEGLGIGGGITHVGDRFESSVNRLELQSYTLVDLTAFYYLPLADRSQLRLQLGVKNLTDEEYYTPNNGTLSLGVGQPRTVYGSIAYEF